MINRLVNALWNEIEVIVSPDLFSLSCKGRKLELETVLYLSVDVDKPRVLAVGEGAVPTQPYRKVKLFRRGASPGPPGFKMDCLEAFLRYAIREVSDRWTIIRPLVVFKNLASLDDCLGGYQDAVLRHAGKKAGARECRFEW